VPPNLSAVLRGKGGSLLYIFCEAFSAEDSFHMLATNKQVGGATTIGARVRRGASGGVLLFLFVTIMACPPPAPRPPPRPRTYSPNGR
jgi:hypothetical protein